MERKLRSTLDWKQFKKKFQSLCDVILSQKKTNSWETKKSRPINLYSAGFFFQFFCLSEWEINQLGSICQLMVEWWWWGKRKKSHGKLEKTVRALYTGRQCCRWKHWSQCDWAEEKRFSSLLCPFFFRLLLCASWWMEGCPAVDGYLSFPPECVGGVAQNATQRQKSPRVSRSILFLFYFSYCFLPKNISVYFFVCFWNRKKVSLFDRKENGRLLFYDWIQ